MSKEKGWACNFHGDLQFDNIIYSKNKFKLIDWRDSFDGRNKGDIYYDFAKLLGGIDLNYKFIKKETF